jgi:hypothetical protein
MIVYEIGTNVTVKASGEKGTVIAHDGYGTVNEFLRLNPKPYILDILDDEGKMKRFDAEELEKA